MFEYDKHYRNCAQNNHPFIKARINPANQNYYHVQIDLATCDYCFSDEGKVMLKKLFQDEKDHQRTNAFLDYSIDDELSWVDGVIPERLNNFCNELFELSQKYQKISKI